MHAIIPALDEAETIAAVVDQVAAHVDHVIVVDNGSRDQTATVAGTAGADVIFEPQRGYGAACLAAIASLRDRPDADIALFIDADGQSDPADIPRLLEPIKSGDAELIMGSRALGAERGSLNTVQRFGNWLASRLLATLYGASATDLGPTRAITLGALRSLEMRERGFGWTIEMQARAALIGLRVGEVPVGYRQRAAGKSKISGTIKGSAKAGARILWTLHTARRPR